MNSEFKGLKRSSKKGQEWSESLRQSTKDLFPGQNARSHIRVMSLEVEMHELR